MRLADASPALRAFARVWIFAGRSRLFELRTYTCTYIYIHVYARACVCMRRVF